MLANLAYGTRSLTAIAVPRPSAADDLLDQLKKGLTALANIFTNAGTAVINNRIIQAGTAPKYIGWGTSTTAAAVTDTALGAEAAPTAGGGRTAGTESRATTTVSNDTYQVQGTVTATSTLAITEAGTFDAASAGNMPIHAVFSAVNVNSGDSIQFTFGLQQIA